MATLYFSPVLYRGCIEWSFNELREWLEISKQGHINVTKRSSEVEFTVPLKNETKRYSISWHIAALLSTTTDRYQLTIDGYYRHDFSCSVCASVGTVGSGVNSSSVGIKGSLTISDKGSNTIKHEVSFKSLFTNKAVNYERFFDLPVTPDSIPFNNCVKLVCNLVVYDMDSDSTPSTLQLQNPGPPKMVHSVLTKEYIEWFTHSLNKDRAEGATTDAKHDKEEYKVHKCVLAIHSDFFKARFSDHWDIKNGEVNIVDMNDPDLTTDIIEALLCSAYTGKVENLEMALKLLPVTDKYQFKKLKLTCESLISSELNKENVLEIYVLAKQCDAQDLKSKCETLVRF